MINLELTPKIQEWLNTDADKRDVKAGAELLLRINRNRVLYNNIIRNPAKYAKTLEYQLQKILKSRLVDITHKEVAAMMTKVDAIADRYALRESKRSEFQRGKRADHDELPDEIRQLYVDNADIMRRMRDTHTRLRMISSLNSSCPDSDRFPLAKALIEYDVQYRNNWNVYDHYIKGSAVGSTVKAVDERTARQNAVKSLNLLLGKYAKKPSDAYAERIKTLYAAIPDPDTSLHDKMIAAGLLDE